MEPITHLLFDFAEVVGLPQPADAMEGMAEFVGLNVDDFSTRYWALRPEYDRGQSAAQYWPDVVGRPLDSATLTQLVDLDMASWTVLDGNTIDLLQQAREAGLRLGLLSNAPPELARAVQAIPLMHELFDELCFSSELQAIKPEPAAFHKALQRLGGTTANTVFIDDRQANVDGARTLGMRAVLFTPGLTYERLMETAR